MTTAERPPALDRLHDVLVLALLALRPLCWDGAPGQPADLIWQALAAAALALVAVERAAGLRPAWNWGWRGMVGLVLVLGLLPAVLAAPEPAPAWCRWSGWVACLAAAGYLAQVLPGRVRLAVAALMAGFAMVAVLALMQRAVVLPAMAAAQAGGASMFEAVPGGAAAIAERIANGGVFATFTLANQLGSYLALLLSIAAVLAWRASGWQRVLLVAVAAGGLAALALTGAKGAWLALALGLAVSWFVAFPGRPHRWLPFGLGAVGLIAVIGLGLMQTSIEVRLGYWRSAGAMIAEAPLTGHGLGGFAAHQSRVMQVGDEPTRLAHNEVLEAAVAGGWGLGLLALAALIALGWPRRAVTVPNEDTPTHAPWIPGLLLVAAPYAAALGALDGNLGWWPGGELYAGILAWSVLLGAVGAGVAWAVVRIPPPPAWALAGGLAAVAAKALIDFDLHAAGLVGSAVAVAVLAGAPGRSAGGAIARLLPVVAAAGAAAVIAVGAMTGLRLSDAASWIAQARMVRDPAVAEDLARRLDLPLETPPRELMAEAAMRAWGQGEGDPGTLLAALDLLPPAPATRGMAEGLARAAPHSAAAALMHAERLAAGRDWSGAAAEIERAVGLAPNAPQVLLRAGRLLERSGDQTLRTRGAALVGEAQRLDPLVHPVQRLPSTDAGRGP